MEVKKIKHKFDQRLKTSFCRYKNFFKGFTLVEITIVVVLIGIVAGFGIPTYTKIIRKAHERNAVLGLVLINKANEVYEAKKGEYLPAAANLAAINSGLSIDVKALDMTYTYTRTAADAFTASSAWTGNNPFTVEVNQGPIILGTNPYCSVGPCPTLP